MLFFVDNTQTAFSLLNSERVSSDPVSGRNILWVRSYKSFSCLRPLGGCSCLTFLLHSKPDGVGDQRLLSRDTTAESE